MPFTHSPQIIMSRRFPKLFFMLMLLVLTALPGCRSEKEKLNALCADLQDATLLTSDCSIMAQKLEKLTPEFQNHVQTLNQSVPAENERPAYLDAISPCISAYLEIQTGPCGQDAAVQKALPKP